MPAEGRLPPKHRMSTQLEGFVIHNTAIYSIKVLFKEDQ
jgi:hypothetical protein